MRKLSFFSFIATAALGACSPYSPDLGDVPFLCNATDPQCPSGYTCQMVVDKMACVSEDGAKPDASGPGFPCADDSSLEGGARNDTTQNAYQTPVDVQRMDLTLAGLAICPAGDKDHYAVTISPGANKGIDVTVSWDSGQPIAMSLLNAGGASIVNGVANGDKMLRACAKNLPPGTYYTVVSATGMTQNNYRLALKASAAVDCL
jgi:hypothetical protein